MKKVFLLGACVILFLLPACTRRPPLSFSPGAFPEATVGQPYEVNLTVSDHVTPVFNISVDSAALPPGLVLNYERNADTAVISGIPEKAGVFKLTISAWCYGTNVSGQTGHRDYVLTVK